MRSWHYGMCFIAAALPSSAFADESRYVAVEVQEAYLDLRALPDLRYPAANIVERGEQVQLLKRRTNWYLLRTEQGQQGWVAEAQMGDSLKAVGAEPYSPLWARQAAKNKN